MKIQVLLMSTLLSFISSSSLCMYPSQEELNARLRACNLEDVITHTDLTYKLAYIPINSRQADLQILSSIETLKPIMAKRANFYGQSLSNQNAINDFFYLKSCLGPDFFKNR